MRTNQPTNQLNFNFQKTKAHIQSIAIMEIRPNR